MLTQSLATRAASLLALTAALAPGCNAGTLDARDGPLPAIPDTVAPSVTLVGPAGPQTYTAAQTVTLVADASDDVGVIRVELFDGATLAGADSTAPYELAWSFDASDNGAHSFTAKAFDTSGNSATSAPLVLTVSIADPPVGTALDVVVDVPAGGPYGTRTFSVPARSNWVSTGLYLRAGQSAVISATGTWQVGGVEVGPNGGAGGSERGCARGQLVARSGLRYEDTIACIGASGTFTAPHDDVVYVSMISSSDLLELYQDRLALDGALSVTVTSDGDTVPSVPLTAIGSYPLAEVASGFVEVYGAHTIVTIATVDAIPDQDVAAAGLATLDAIWEIEADLRGASPYDGQRVRWFPDPTVSAWGYMLSGNPVRCMPEIMNGGFGDRILRVADDTGLWGFAHELGHAFSVVNGTWWYLSVNGESWPNIFTLHVLRALERTADEVNYATYCDGRDAYLQGQPYEVFKTDPFLQLCFLMEFETTYGLDFYRAFFAGMNSQSNADVHYDGSDAAVWRYVRDRFSLAAGEDTTARFLAWRVPLE